MNREDNLIELLQARVNGRVIEKNRYMTGWAPIDPFTEMDRIYQDPKLYRIRPQPKTRPWSKPEDVPQNARFSSGIKDHFFLPIYAGANGVCMFNAGTWRCIEWNELHLYWQWSLDSKTWHKCEVVEEVQP